MNYQYRILSEGTTEPVSLDEAKSYMRIDADYAAEDDVISNLISASRERLEKYLNVGLIDKQIELQWNGSAIVLPFSPTQEVVSVKETDDTIVDPDKYTVNGLDKKTIFLNSFGGYDVVWFYPQFGEIPEIWSGSFCSDKMYNVIYNTGEWDRFPTALKMAILADVDYMYKMQGLPEQQMISEQAISLSASFSQNLIIRN